jgi:galactose mutarotase-like enzyme
MEQHDLHGVSGRANGEEYDVQLLDSLLGRSGRQLVHGRERRRPWKQAAAQADADKQRTLEILERDGKEGFSLRVCSCRLQQWV